MTTEPRTSFLPVHCCCDPSLRLGWIPVPLTKRAGSEFRIVVVSPSKVRDLGAPLEMIYIEAEVQWLTRGDVRTLAVKSGHQPIEVWRRVHGFIENRAARLSPAMRSRSAHWSAAAPCAASATSASDATP